MEIEAEMVVWLREAKTNKHPRTYIRGALRATHARQPSLPFTHVCAAACPNSSDSHVSTGRFVRDIQTELNGVDSVAARPDVCQHVDRRWL